MSNGEKGKGGKGRETAGWIQCHEKKRRAEHTGEKKAVRPEIIKRAEN